jgi:glycosyltransferase involved in cell wall biosynthesis
MWNNKTIAVILPTYNEKDSIRSCIEGFEQTGWVDEIIVINNNAAQGTSEEVRGTSAREVHEPVQGYGAAIQRGFRETKCDLVVVCEPDATFLPGDILKLLSYSMDFDFVLGTRTLKEFIWTGANMDRPLRWGNYSVAKMMEFLFNTTTLSDVGCTYRLIKREALEAMQPFFRVKGNFFGPEMMLLAAEQGISMVQIPVNYCPRVGVSSVTGDRIKAIKLGFRMIWLILEFRTAGWFKKGRFSGL